MMDAAAIKRLDKAHNLHSWSIQSAVDPIVFERSEGVYFWDSDGKRHLDFSSQLMNLNLGHQHPRVVRAIQEQAAKVCYCAPDMAYESRSALVKALSEVTPGDLNHFFFALGGGESNENAIKMARLCTGKFKVISRYRSYHGATYGAISLTGDPRRPPLEPGIPGVLKVLDPYCYRCPFGQSYPACGIQCARHVEEVILYENPDSIAALFVEGVAGSNGVLVPPPEYMPMLRDICDKYKILLVSDEVLSGFGRTGKWFAVDHWNVVPDMLVMAKGLTSGYVPLGCVAVSDQISEYFNDNMLWTGLTCNAHPLACAAASAALQVYKEENLVENSAQMGRLLKEALESLAKKHASVGNVRAIGLLSVIELVRDRATREPLVSWNATGTGLSITKEINKRLMESGVFTFVRWNLIIIAPPLIITKEELEQGLAVIDRTLDYADACCG